MSQRERLKEVFSTFSFEIIDEYKNITLMIKEDSGFLSIFRKKRYGETIEKLAQLLKTAKSLDLSGLSPDDALAKEIAGMLDSAVNTFERLCSAQIRLQELLKQKAEKKGTVKMSDCSMAMHRINEDTSRLQNELRALDIKWADFLEEDE